MSEAREAMESAARNGEQPPLWVQTFMSPARWERYRQLCEEAGHSDQVITEPVPHTGVDGFSSPDNNAPASQSHPGQGQRQLQNSVQTVPSFNPMQAIAMLETIKDYGQASACTCEDSMRGNLSNLSEVISVFLFSEEPRQRPVACLFLSKDDLRYWAKN